MVKRFTIGLNYFFDNHSNSGIVNYIYNIIAALKSLPDSEKPAIVVFFSENAPVDYLRTIDYPYINFLLFQPYPSNFILRKMNGLVRRIIKNDIFKQVFYYSKIDSLYPCFTINDNNFDDYKNRIFWLVDFNNRAFPDHYGDEGTNMMRNQQELTLSNRRVVLSSNALFDELKTYYPDYKCDIKLLRFASSLQKLEDGEIPLIKRKYNIEVPYLMSPNQLWEHKNQGLVLDAVNIIKQKQPELKFKILFSGSLKVNRGKGLYIDALRNKIEKYGLHNYVEFLGVLERNEQLLLMKGSSALLQPSLYEGWSTLVEEAKALNKFIILSSLPVHKEQISENVVFFDPHNAQQLADKILNCLTRPQMISQVDYQKNIYNYGKDILNALTTKL
jgi:glycosyltransferase involved in cell wall biosynthesis